MVYAAQGDLLTAQCNVPIYSDPTNVGDILRMVDVNSYSV